MLTHFITERNVIFSDEQGSGAMQAKILKVQAYFIVNKAEEAIAFYKEAFGAEELFRMTDPADGRIGHAELRLGETVMMLADEYPDFGAVGPETVGGSPVTFHLATDSADALLERALAAGATLLRGPRRPEFRRARRANPRSLRPSLDPLADHRGGLAGRDAAPLGSRDRRVSAGASRRTGCRTPSASK